MFICIFEIYFYFMCINVFMCKQHECALPTEVRRWHWIP